MRVKEVMTEHVECTRPDATLQEAAERMRELNVGSLPVCDAGRLVGMLTDRDITIRAVAKADDPLVGHVSGVMTPGVTYCFEDQDITEAACLMEEKGIRRLPVLNHEKRLVGIVSLGDIAIEAGDDHLAGETLERVSEAVPTR